LKNKYFYLKLYVHNFVCGSNSLNLVDHMYPEYSILSSNIFVTLFQISTVSVFQCHVIL